MNGNRVLLILVGLALVAAVVLGVVGVRYNTEASHIGTFPDNAEWIQPAAPHPEGWNCWLLSDADLDLNAPYLLWCDTQN